MATHQIFLRGTESSQSNLERGVSYLYEDGFLRVYDKGRVVCFQTACKGDAFVVICEKGKIILRKLVPPSGKGALVAWLLRFNKDNRAKSFAEYERRLRGQRLRRFWEGYMEREHKSQGYVFTLCNSPFDDNYRNVAGFVSDAISKEEVTRLIPLMVHHPDWYVQELLTEHFGLTEKEFREASQKTFKPL